MSIPPRAQHRIFPIPGPYTIVGIAIFLALAGVLAGTKIGKSIPEPMILIAILVIMLPTWIGSHFDRKARSKRIARLLEAHGFIPCKKAELDPGYLQAAQGMKPMALKPGTIKSALVGVVNEREVILCEHTVGHGRYKQHLISCAVWTPTEWPKTIIRQRNLLDRVRSTQDLGVERFDKLREIVSDDLDHVRPMLSPVADWLFVEKLKAMSFRMMPQPGMTEQWIFDSHWVVHADRGRANPKTLPQMPAFLVDFIEQLEAQLPSG